MAKLIIQQGRNADDLLQLKADATAAYEESQKLSRERTKFITKLKVYQRYQDNCEDSEKVAAYGVKIAELEKAIREKSAEYAQITERWFALAEQIKAIEDAAKDKEAERYECQRNGFLWKISWLNNEKNRLLNYKSHSKKAEKIAEYEAKIAEVQKKIDAKKQELAEIEKVSILEDDGSNDEPEEDFFATIGFLIDNDSEDDDELIAPPEQSQPEDTEKFEVTAQVEVVNAVNVQTIFNSLSSLGIIAFGKLKKPIVDHSKLKKPPRYPSNFP